MPDICIWNRCNNNCIMCTNPPGFKKKSVSQKYSFERIINRATSKADVWIKNREALNFTGGEPTIHPHFLKLFWWFRKKFPDNKIALATNGRLLSYPEFAKDLLQFENLTFELPILGPRADVHDAITRTKGSFDEVLKGLSNILEWREESCQEIEIRIIIIKQNYQLLDEILNLISSEFVSVDRVVIIFPEPEGVCKENYDFIGLYYKDVSNQIASIVKKWRNKFSDLRLYHFPLCVVEKDLWKHTWITQREDEVSFPSVCQRCIYKKYCCGVHKDYLSLIGKKEFKPIVDKSNLKIGENPCHPIIDNI